MGKLIVQCNDVTFVCLLYEDIQMKVLNCGLLFIMCNNYVQQSLQEASEVVLSIFVKEKNKKSGLILYSAFVWLNLFPGNSVSCYKINKLPTFIPCTLY